MENKKNLGYNEDFYSQEQYSNWESDSDQNNDQLFNSDENEEARIFDENFTKSYNIQLLGDRENNDSIDNDEDDDKIDYDDPDDDPIEEDDDEFDDEEIEDEDTEDTPDFYGTSEV